MAAGLKPAVALLPWGDVVEDFLEPIGLGLDDFAARMTDGWLFGYVAALQSAGHRVIVLCASKHVTEPRLLEHAATGAPIWAVPGQTVSHPTPWRRSVRQWRSTPYRGFAEVLRAERAGALLVQDYEHARFDAIVALAAALRLPVFATFQGGDVTLSPLERLVRRYSLRRTRGIVVASARERSRLTASYPRLPLRIAEIPNPIDTDRWRSSSRAEARDRLGLSEEVFLVMSHGRIDIRRKGLDVLLEAWREFSASHTDARLLLVGSGQDRDDLARLLAGPDYPNVTWHAEYVTDRERMRRWLSAADAYVITSRVEGMPVAPLEAMACGLPVVASRASGLPEIFPDGERSGGILVPCEDPRATAAALRRLAASPELRGRLRRAARARVEERFSVPSVGLALDELIRSGRG